MSMPTHSSLKVGDYLPLQGPSVYQGLTPSNDPPTPDSPAIPPLRPAHQALLAQDGPAFSSTGWVIQLKEEVLKYEGIGRYQTWIAEVKRSKDSKKVYPVLLRINRPGLYNPSHLRSGPWSFTEQFTTIVQWVENTAAHYWYYASLQGREATYCYGLFTFDLPDEPGCFGFVIEDFMPIFTTIGRWAEAVKYVYSGKPVAVVERRGEMISLSAKSLAVLTRSQFQLQHRFAECAPEFATPLDDLVVLRTSTPEHIHFIIPGWLVPEPLGVIKDRNERLLAEFERSEGKSLMEKTGMSKARTLEYMQLHWQVSDPASTNLCYIIEQYFRSQDIGENSLYTTESNFVHL